MIKKIIPVLLVIFLTLTMAVCAAETSADAVNPNTERQEENSAYHTPPGGNMHGERMNPRGGMPPQNEDVPPSGEGSQGDFQDGNFPGPHGMGKRGEMWQNGEFPDADGQAQQENTNQTDTQTPQSAETEDGFLKTYSTPVFSVVLLGFAFLFVIFYKRKTF